MNYSNTTNSIVYSAFTVESIGQTTSSGLLVLFLSEFVADLVIKVGASLYETTLFKTGQHSTGYGDEGLVIRDKIVCFIIVL